MAFSKDTRDTKDSSHFAKEKLSFHLGRAPLSDLNVVNVAKLWSYEMNRCSALAYNGDVGVIIPSKRLHQVSCLGSIESLGKRNKTNWDPIHICSNC